MGGGKLADNYGYTLMELIMAAAIITIISAVAIPNYTRYIASTRENVCIINRQTIVYEYYLHYINEPEMTLEDYLRTYYPEEEGSFCSSGGTYNASGSGETAKISCSVHEDSLSADNVEAALMEIPEPVLTPILLPEPVINIP